MQAFTAADIYLQQANKAIRNSKQHRKVARKRQGKPIRLPGGCLLYRFPKAG